MSSRLILTSLTLAALALTTPAAFANTSTHDFGPHTRAQIDTICDSVHGQPTSAPGAWGCDATRFAIACTLYGKHCIIGLFVRPDGSIVHTATAGSGDTFNSGTGNPPPGGSGGGNFHYPIVPVVTGLSIGQPGHDDTLTGVNGSGSQGAGWQPLPGH